MHTAAFDRRRHCEYLQCIRCTNRLVEMVQCDPTDKAICMIKKVEVQDELTWNFELKSTISTMQCAVCPVNYVGVLSAHKYRHTNTHTQIQKYTNTQVHLIIMQTQCAVNYVGMQSTANMVFSHRAVPNQLQCNTIVYNSATAQQCTIVLQQHYGVQ